MNKGGRPKTIRWTEQTIAEASRLWRETGAPASRIAEVIGVTRASFSDMRKQHRSRFGEREFLEDDPAPEELEARVLAVREARVRSDEPPNPSSVPPPAIRCYSFDRRSFCYSRSSP